MTALALRLRGVERRFRPSRRAARLGDGVLTRGVGPIDLELAAAVRQLSATELVETFDERVAVGGALRRKVASHYFSQADDARRRGMAPDEASAPEPTAD